ncbi:MAG: hypothetical protein R2825_13930 [Saprospiraceae bacterium]
MFVAAIGQAFNPNPERGVFRTKNGGQTWEKVLHISDSTGFVDVEYALQSKYYLCVSLAGGA